MLPQEGQHNAGWVKLLGWTKTKVRGTKKDVELEASMAVYKPKSIDVSEVILSNEQLKLLERLAENAHDVWAEKRIGDGWRFGPARNDTAKTHPSLIPY